MKPKNEEKMKSVQGVAANELDGREYMLYRRLLVHYSQLVGDCDQLYDGEEVEEAVYAAKKLQGMGLLGLFAFHHAQCGSEFCGFTVLAGGDVPELLRFRVVPVAEGVPLGWGLVCDNLGFPHEEGVPLLWADNRVCGRADALLFLPGGKCQPGDAVNLARWGCLDEPDELMNGDSDELLRVGLDGCPAHGLPEGNQRVFSEAAEAAIVATGYEGAWSFGGDGTGRKLMLADADDGGLYFFARSGKEEGVKVVSHQWEPFGKLNGFIAACGDLLKSPMGVCRVFVFSGADARCDALRLLGVAGEAEGKHPGTFAELVGAAWV